MICASIKNPELLKVHLTGPPRAVYGCDQNWYGTWWKRTSGCGPSTFSNIVCYLNRRRLGANAPPLYKSELVQLMDDVWKYVTPSPRGIPTTAAFISGATDYIKKYDAGMSVAEFPALKKSAPRPGIRGLTAFLSDALTYDAPVAFLAIDSGGEKRLEDWHWVTLLAIEYDESRVLADIVNNGNRYTVDLAHWYNSTARGGGFVAINK